jgi:hypothetical protein
VVLWLERVGLGIEMDGIRARRGVRFSIHPKRG